MINIVQRTLKKRVSPSIVTVAFLVLLIGCQKPVSLFVFSPEDKTDITLIENYLNADKTRLFQFIHQWPDAHLSSGLLEYHPGHLSMTYQSPAPIKIVADERSLVMTDPATQSTTKIGLLHNPLGLLLRNPVSLTNQILITNIRRTAGLIELSLIAAKGPSQGLLTLTFSRDTHGELHLRSLKTTDIRGSNNSILLAR